MTSKQFDAIYLEMKKLSSRIASLEEQCRLSNVIMKSLTDKTVVVTSLDQDIAKLRTDIAALIDEKEA